MATNPLEYRIASEEALTRALKAGDQAAYAEIYDRYFDLLFRHALSMLKDEEDARDAIHDVFTVLWAKHADLQINDSLSGYLYSFTRNGVLKTIRRGHVAEKYLSAMTQLEERYEPSPEIQVRQKELEGIIEAEIENLPPKMREVFVLSRYHHLSHREIAEKLGLSENTVKRQTSNALAILRKSLAKWFFLSLFFSVL